MSSEVVNAFSADLQDAVCAWGVFDGVHRGHQFIIGRAQDAAQGLGKRMVLLTFDIDPTELFNPAGSEKLMTNSERLSLLAEQGADTVAVIPFDRRMAALAPRIFLDSLLASRAPRAMVVGEDFRFGQNAQGSLSDLVAWGTAQGMSVEGAPLFQMDGAPVTSTRIRACLGRGGVEEAARLLGRPYSLSGEVVSGRHVGRELGVCTANLSVPPLREVPADGVYAAYAKVDGSLYRAAVSVGVPVTFEDARERTLEAHILDFDQDIYGRCLELRFARRLRPMVKFDGAQQLMDQINADIAETRKLPLV